MRGPPSVVHFVFRFREFPPPELPWRFVILRDREQSLDRCPRKLRQVRNNFRVYCVLLVNGWNIGTGEEGKLGEEWVGMKNK